MKYISFLIIIVFSVKLQSQVEIDYNFKQGKIEGFSLENSIGLFHINQQGNLNIIILDYKENNKPLQLVADVNNTRIYVVQLNEIHYPDIYPISNFEESLPVSINGHQITYFTDFYDNENLKGKIKSIDNIQFTYYTDYYLPKEIKGNIKSIGDLDILYVNDYPINERIKGEIKQIGSIKIKYYDFYSKDYIKGKITRIGKMNIEYFDNYYTTNRNGMFKNILGDDERFNLSLVK